MEDTQEVIVRDEHYSIPRRTITQKLFAPFWTLPTLVIAASFAAGLFLPMLDKSIFSENGSAFPGGPDGARSVLSTIAGAMISVTSLVFSMTMVVMQLASSQFTPRVLSTFLSNRVAQYTLGVFVGSFVYTLTILREVRGEVDNFSSFVPQISVSVAYFLVLLAMGLFIAFIQQVTSMIQVSRVIARLGEATVEGIDRMFIPADAERTYGTWDTGDERTLVRVVGEHGHVVEVDERRLVSYAKRNDLRIDFLARPGQYLAEGHPLAQVWGEAEEMESKVNACVLLGADRNSTQDPTFGVRQLVDIGERALSPAINDPTTALQVLHQIDRVLRLLVTRQSPTGYLTDSEGEVRVHCPQPTVAGVLRLGLEEISHYGRNSVQIPRAIQSILNGLSRIALPEHAEVLDRLQAELTSSPGGSRTLGI